MGKRYFTSLLSRNNLLSQFFAISLFFPGLVNLIVGDWFIAILYFSGLVGFYVHRLMPEKFYFVVVAFSVVAFVFLFLGDWGKAMMLLVFGVLLWSLKIFLDSKMDSLALVVISENELIINQLFYIPNTSDHISLSGLEKLIIFGPGHERIFRFVYQDGIQREVNPYFGYAEKGAINFILKNFPSDMVIIEPPPNPFERTSASI
ncbi:MAG: hypothetical protein R3F37_13805 [Candidatus Competibacteraceae bacterium]